MARFVDHIYSKETENGFDEEFNLNEDIIEYKQLTDLDFEDLAKKPELLTMELSNYFKYSDTYEADHNITFIFDAKYDNSSIRVESDKDTSVKIVWCVGYKFQDKDMHDCISYRIEEEIVPEIIEKLIKLGKKLKS